MAVLLGRPAFEDGPECPRDLGLEGDDRGRRRGGIFAPDEAEDALEVGPILAPDVRQVRVVVEVIASVRKQDAALREMDDAHARP